MEKTWLKSLVTKFEGFREYNFDDVKIFISNTPAPFEAGQHSHAEYEFMLVRTQDIPTLCKGKRTIMKRGHFMPFNSFDVHGQESSAVIDSFICIIFHADLIKKVALNAFGFKQKPVFENECFLPSPTLSYFLGVFIDDYKDKENSYYQTLLKELIVIELFKCAENNVVKPDSKAASPIIRAKKYLDENYKMPFDLQKIADIAGLNKFYFIKKFKEELQTSPHQYLLQLKMQKAKTMISLGEKNFTEIAFDLGFSTQSHFITQFKKSTGIAPGEYKKTIIK